MCSDCLCCSYNCAYLWMILVCVFVTVTAQLYSEKISGFMQGSQFALFQGGTFTSFLMFWGVFSPLLHQLRGYHSVFQAASPLQAMSEDSKSYFECSIWILTVKCNAHGFTQCYYFQNQKIAMLENIGYTELKAWRCCQGHRKGSKFQ